MAHEDAGSREWRALQNTVAGEELLNGGSRDQVQYTQSGRRKGGDGANTGRHVQSSTLATQLALSVTQTHNHSMDQEVEGKDVILNFNTSKLLAVPLLANAGGTGKKEIFDQHSYSLPHAAPVSRSKRKEHSADSIRQPALMASTTADLSLQNLAALSEHVDGHAAYERERARALGGFPLAVLDS